MNTSYLFLFIIVLCLSINPFLKKRITKNLNGIEFNFANTICILVLLFIIIFYTNFISKSDNFNINFLKKLNKNDIMLLICSSMCTLLASVLFIQTIKNLDVSFVVPFTQASTIVASTIIGVLVMKETFNYKVGSGILLIISGIYLMNKK
jgi:uncharacterized membrane protein